MSKNTNDWILEDLESVEKHRRLAEPVRQTLLVQKYLQNPFSLTWLKLAALFQSAQVPNNQPKALEEDQFEQYEPITSEEKFYFHFTGSVNPANPSLYYTILRRRINQCS